MARLVRVTVDHSPMDICLAEPAGAGQHPAVVVMHHRYGIEDFTRGICDWLAEAGFVAAAPDLFHRRPFDEDIAVKRERIRDDETIDDIAATIDWLRTRAAVRRPDMAILGHCLGGRMALVGASAFPECFRAAVVLYGGHMFRAYGDGLPTAFDRLRRIRCPVLGLYGKDDFNPSPADVDRIDAELSRLGVPHVFHRYDGAGHGFAHFTIPELYREAAADDAARKVVGFLREAFGKPDWSKALESGFI